RKKVYACATDRSFVWPNCTYIKITCGDELIGEDINDKERIERLKCEGHLIAGTLVFYRDKMRLFKERRDETKVHILPLEIQDVHGKFVVGSPSPPTDLYLKKRMCLDTENKDLGTIVIGVD
ncbi:MAG: hypothetical protein QFX35_01800, partial [Candidatus Verstraetearchaeota archaeon]|nr:hypothetical protein [Candidatus Verstraetearchaeota archaeon]